MNWKRTATATRALLVRAGGGRLAVVGRGLYATAARVVAASFVVVDREAAVYAAGSLGRGEPVVGLSDLDMVVVAPADPSRPGARRDRLARHVDRLERLVPGPPRAVLEIATCEEDELRRTMASTALTRGLVDAAHAGFLADAGWRIVAELQERPGVGQPLRRWRHLAGPDRRPATPPDDRERRRLDAWLELQHWWRHAFNACLAPSELVAAHVCVKLVSEPLRAWLWLERAEAPRTRHEALTVGLRALPEEEPALRRALDLERGLHRLPEAPLADAVAFLVRLTGRVAAALAVDAADAGSDAVRLVGEAGDLLLPASDTPSTGLLPLADWRALVAPRLPDEALAPHAGDPADPAVIAAAARRWRAGALPALRTGVVTVLPTIEAYREGMLRAVASSATDPASSALLDGLDIAAFPRLRGWSAADVAARAVAEHAAWLRAAPAGPPPRRYLALGPVPQTVVAVARLLTAARAAVFAAGVDRGDPVLPVAVRAAARLTERAELAEAIELGSAALAAWHAEGRPCAEADVERIRRAVVVLDAYGDGSTDARTGGVGRSASAARRRS